MQFSASKCLFRDQHSSLLVPFKPAGHGKVHLIEGQRFFAGQNVSGILRDQLLVILLRIEPKCPVDTHHEKKCFSVAFGDESFADFGWHEHAILLVDCEFVFAEEKSISSCHSFPLILSDQGISTTSFHFFNKEISRSAKFLQVCCIDRPKAGRNPCHDVK